MSSFASRTGQKIKEWWGAKVTVDPQLEINILKDQINLLVMLVPCFNKYMDIWVGSVLFHLNFLKEKQIQIKELELKQHQCLGIYQNYLDQKYCQSKPLFY